MERIILHCDMNNFFASCECITRPELKEVPMAVAGSIEERHGIILAKNEIAKKYGIQTAEAIWQAKRKCPSLVIVKPDFDLYVEYSRKAHAIYCEYTDMVEPFGIDECWLDVSGSTYLFGNGIQIAEKIRKRIKKELSLTISVGVSFNKVLAKLGSDLKKPDAVTALQKDNFREKIWNLPACEMIGVGKATYKKFCEAGVKTIGDIANMQPAWAESRFGKAGVILWQYANGYESSPVLKSDYIPDAKSIGHGVTPIKDLENNDEVWRIILSLTQEIEHKLRTQHLSAKGVQISVRSSTLNTQECQKALPYPTQSALCISKEAFSLFINNYNWNDMVRTITVRAIDLIRDDIPFQLNFFTDFSKIEKQDKIETTAEMIRNKYGNDAIKSAALYMNLFLPSKQLSLFPTRGIQSLR